MNCDDLSNRFDEWLDSRQGDVPDELRAHLAGCDRCRCDWEACETLQQAIASWNAETLEIDLVDRVLRSIAAAQSHDALPAAAASQAGDRGTVAPGPRLASLSAARPSQAAPTGTRSAAVVAIVATVLLLVAVPTPTNRPRDAAIPSTVAANGAAGPAEPGRFPGKADTPALENAAVVTLVRDAGAVCATLASDVVLTLSDAALLVSSPQRPGIPSGSPPAAGSRNLWSRELPAELQPIGRDVEDALDFLRQVVPSDPTPAT